jgi:site-specific DNA recombinase
MARRRRAQQRETPAELAPGCEVWAYLRVSSEQQAEKGLPIEGQRQVIERYCAERGYRLTRTYVDEALSASTDERPEFVAMVEDAERRGPAAVVMWKWDRFSRSVDDAPYYRGRLRRGGIEMVTLADAIPANAGELRPVFEAFADVFNARYLKELSRNVRRGQKALAEMGYVPTAWHDANRPIGYRMVERTIQVGTRDHAVHAIELDPETAPLARRAWEMRLGGATYRQINDALEIRTRATNLRLMFRNPLYRGVYRWGEVEIPVPAIVTEAEWQAVQAGLGGRGGALPRRRGSAYLLSGLAFCGRCGLALTGSTSSPGGLGPYRYYLCRHPDTRRTCGQRAIKAGPLEALVVERLLREVLSVRWLERHGEELALRAGQAAKEREARRSALEREQAECRAALAHLVAAIEGGANVAAVLGRLRERERDLVRIERDLGLLEQEAEAAEEEAHPDVEGMRERLAAAIAAGQVKAARELIRVLVERVVVGEDGIASITMRGIFCLR